MRQQRQQPRRRGGAGFSLIELLLALTLALLLCGVVVQALAADGQGLQLLVRRQRQALLQRRLLDLLRDELLRAEVVQLGSAPAAACPLGGRAPVLQLRWRSGTAITYSLGTPPSAIWRGAVLMRCGPAYGLDGEPSSGASQQRVMLDGLASGGFRAERLAPGRLRVSVVQTGASAAEAPVASSLELAHGGS